MKKAFVLSPLLVALFAQSAVADDTLKFRGGIGVLPVAAGVGQAATRIASLRGRLSTEASTMSCACPSHGLFCRHNGSRDEPHGRWLGRRTSFGGYL